METLTTEENFKFTPPLRGLLKKAFLSGDKGNPPYPPCQGGKKNQNPLSPVGRIAFLYPPDKGG